MSLWQGARIQCAAWQYPLEEIVNSASPAAARTVRSKQLDLGPVGAAEGRAWRLNSHLHPVGILEATVPPDLAKALGARHRTLLSALPAAYACP